MAPSLSSCEASARPACHRAVPASGFLGPLSVAPDVWLVRAIFPLGSAQTSGLTYSGLRGRLLGLLGPNPLAHPALSFRDNESTKDEVMEEVAAVQDLLAGRQIDLPLDITMTIVREPRSGDLTLHSVVPLSPALLSAVMSLGTVTALLAPNLQHWLFLAPWLAAFPQASLGLAPEALEERLEDKVPGLEQHAGRVWTLGDNHGMQELAAAGITGHLLQGAPLNLNEFLFYHEASATLIASDTFYGGYVKEETPSWFARLWFKLTRDGSFRRPRLPSYRTSRVVTHGSPQLLLASAAEMMDKFGQVDRIVFAHGSSPFTKEQLSQGRTGERKGWNGPGALKSLYVQCWKDGLASAGQDSRHTCQAFCTADLCIKALG